MFSQADLLGLGILARSKNDNSGECDGDIIDAK